MARPEHAPHHRPHRLFAAALLTSALAATAVGCGSRSSREEASPLTSTTVEPVVVTIDPGDGGAYAPEIDPAAFVDQIDNPYLPLAPGTRWVWHETGPDGSVEEITVEVTDQQRTVMGVTATVVHDVARVDGEIVEDTWDWFAQDAEGNVWYLGEDTTAYEGGKATTVGSWEAGVNGALPGIAMPANPTPSDVGYRQEYLAGEAEDMGQVIADGERVTVAAGSYDEVVVTRDWTPLEPGIVEEKWYAPGVGLVQEQKSDGSILELIEHRSSR